MSTTEYEPESESEFESESAPLNPASTLPSHDVATPNNDPVVDLTSSSSSISAEFHEMSTPRKRDPMHILVLYSLSCFVSLGGLGAALAGYGITITAPLDEYNKKWHRLGYERNFLEMQSIVVFLAINVVITALNLRLALKGRQDVNELVWLFNMVYDFLLWASLIGFGVMNMVVMLWDRRLCDGWSDEEMYKKCDVAMFQLLVVELVAVNLGLLAAVLHFILLVGRCCTSGNRDARMRSLHLKKRIREEEEVLMELIERRQQLLEETEGLEARRTGLDRPLPLTPAEDTEGNVQVEEAPQHEEEDLIDMEARHVAAGVLATDDESVSVQQNS